LGFYFLAQVFVLRAVAQLFGFGLLPLKINMLQKHKNNVLHVRWLQKL